MTSREEMERFPREMAPTPCFLNMLAGGLTPLVDAAEAARLGYSIAIWPCFAMTAAYLAWQQAARELKATGMVAERRNERGEIVGGIREIFELCGLKECAEFDKQMGGKAFSNGV